MSATRLFSVELHADKSTIDSFAGITDADTQNHMIKYDIDNPGFPFIYGNMLNQTATALAGHPGIESWMIERVLNIAT